MEEQISIVRQCELLGVSRSGWYYRPVGESEEDLLLKRWMDEQYTLTHFYGSRRMRVWLMNQGYLLSRKRVSRLMQEIGLFAI